MKIFISWSGRRSQSVAAALATWIKKVVQSADIWVSTDLERGVKWLDEIGKSLDEHSLGILCVTPGNVASPWLNFEAGALSKHLGDDGKVIPYLLDFQALSDLKPPLGQFNASLADEDGTWSVVQTLNAQAEFGQSEANLRETFNLFWPQLREQLEAIKRGSNQPTSRRSSDDKLDELLDIARRIEHAQNETNPQPDYGRWLTASLSSSANERLRAGDGWAMVRDGKIVDVRRSAAPDKATAPSDER